jgi:hypothetical protein
LRVIIWKKFQKLFPKCNIDQCLRRAQFISTGSEKTSSQANKYRKLLDDDEHFSLIQEELRPEASQIALDINNANDITQQKRRKEAEKPLYLMRYE